MAKLEDYLKTDDLETEIQEASTATQQRESQLPPQFAGKTAEEIAKSYTELQALQDRQANELGELRKTTSELTNQLLNSPNESDAAPEPITVDDLYADPDAVIDRRVDEKVSAKMEQLEKRQRKLEMREALDDLKEKHPDYREKATSAEMQNWIADSDYRKRLAQAADSGDLQAADDLFSMYNDLEGAHEQKPSVPDANIATLESGRSDITPSVEKFSRHKLENARVLRSQGDREADAWLKANASAIRLAYEEGRIVN